MENMLTTLRPLTSHLIVVFGCGGDRDPGKRPVMGALAAKLADEVIITDDNPRFEDPTTIVQDILSGMDESDQAKVTVICDRAKAIRSAVARCRPGSIVALLGKGHEEYHVVRGEKHAFSDRVEVEKL